MIGVQLSHFRITAKLGEGAMGEVWEAEDQRLGRKVALKLLPSRLLTDPERVQRFIQEARTASALAHPHIVTIHEIGEAVPEGEETGSHPALPLRFIAMERIEGSTLRERIGAERASLEELVRWLAQAADGVAKAHSTGVVHRDLKPDNIMVTRDGYAKVLDFGLAKLTEPLPGDESTALAPERTAEGAVLGTAAYMSPEQVRGEPAEARSDVFAMGLILYEAVTGRRAFAGATSVEVMHQILRGQPPPIRDVAPDCPLPLRRLVDRCLEKDPDRRLQSMKDLALELAALAEDWDEVAAYTASSGATGSGALRSLARPERTRLWVTLAAALLIGFVGIALVQMLRKASEPSASTPRRATFTQITSEPGVESQPTLSPDGQLVAYVRETIRNNRDIYLLRVGGRNAINLTPDHPGHDLQPAFAPGGDRIAFTSDRGGGGIFVMGTTGESVRRLTDFGGNPAWSPDGTRIVFASQIVVDPLSRPSVSALWVVDVATGATEKIYDGDAVQPSWSPSGRRIAFWGLQFHEGGQRDLATIPAEGGEPVPVTDDPSVDWNPVWAPDGSLWFVSDRGGSMNLWRVAVDEATGEVTGPPEPLTTPSRWSQHLAFSASGDLLLFASLDSRTNVVRQSLDLVQERLVEPSEPVTRGSRRFVEPSPSPDGEWIAFRSADRQEDIFLARADGTGFRQLTDDPAKDRGPSWTPEGLILFYSDRGGSYQIWSVRPDGGELLQLTEYSPAVGPWFPLASPDGRWIAAFNSEESVLFDRTTLPLRNPEILSAPEPGRIFAPSAWAPDSSLLVGLALRFGSVEPAPAMIYSLHEGSYRDLGISRSIAGPPKIAAFTPDGRQILFLSEGGLLLVPVLGGDPRALETSSTEMYRGHWIALAQDGRSVYGVQSEDEGDLWLARLDPVPAREAEGTP